MATISLEDLRKRLPDLAEQVAAQLSELYRAPTYERCEQIAIQLDGIRNLVRQLRQAVVQEGEGTP
ncbi:MAG: hypothetical protein ACOH1V_03110 [Stenotrophomonas sp.]